MDPNIFIQLREAEESHLLPEVRTDHNKLSELLDDAFTEIGASGARFTKQDVLDALSNETPCARTIEQFQAHLLAPDIFLTSYIIRKQTDDEQPPTRTRRSTIWIQDQGVMRMRFHQGTPISS